MSRCGYRTRVLLLPPAVCSTLREVPKRDYKAAWEYRDENISFAHCDWRGSGRDGSRTGTDRRRTGTEGSGSSYPKSAVCHLDPEQLARPCQHRHLDDVRRLEGTNSQGCIDTNAQL